MRIGDVRLAILAGLALWFAFTVSVGLGLWRGNSLARHAFLAISAIVLLFVVLVRQRYVELPFVILVCGLVAWYLYAKPSVRKFFEAP